MRAPLAILKCCSSGPAVELWSYDENIMGIFRINGIVGKTVPNTYTLVREQLQQLNLKAVKSIVATYDPFDERSVQTRKFLEFLNNRKLFQKYQFKPQTVIKCDRSEPTISFDLITGKKVVFKAGNLHALEMFELYNRHITPLAPAEEAARETLTTKAMRRGKK